MIRSIFLLLFFIGIIPSIYAQGEANIWYFGNNAGLDFNSGAPVPLLDGQLNTSEGCAAISSANGDLLFYTDGITVWDKNHAVMPNGIGLLGNPSSTQSGLIVPRPGFPDIYYIFSVDDEAGPDGFRFSEVDLSLNAGNGDVTANKNILLSTPTTEKITAIEKANGVDYWVIVHEWNSNNFLSYEITSAGINTTPIVTSVGVTHSGAISTSIGYMKISPNGERLALGRWSDNSIVELFDFDTATGIMSNPILLQNVFTQGSVDGAYGIEFSPNNNLLYVSDLRDNFTSRVHQFNITFNNATDIINSDFILYDGSDYVSGIQIAIDGKIYLANANQQFLDVIENPDGIGVDAGYVNRGLSLDGRSAVFGLPPFIQSFFNVGFQFENTCLGDETIFSVDSNEDITSILWDFGDGTTSSEENPSHIYASSGIYTVEVIVNTEEQTRTLSREVIIYGVPVANEASDYRLCDDIPNDMMASFDLNAKIPEILGTQSNLEYDVAFYATQSQAEEDTDRLPYVYLNTSNNQEIYARIFNSQNSKCYDITAFTLIVDSFPVVNPVDDITFCDDEVLDQTQIIDLNQFNNIILGGQSEDAYSISYHITQEAADMNTGALPSNYQNTSNPQTIYIRIENVVNNECYSTDSFVVTIEDQLIAYTPEDFYTCDDSSNDGIAQFDLTLQNEQIINGQVGNFTITYYTSEEDANNGINQINASYTNSTSPETIYARIQKDGNLFCFDVTSFLITVIPSPDIQLQETRYICSGESVTISAESGFDNYVWSTGATTSSIIVDEAGTYTVEVIEDHQTMPPIRCSNIKTITVVESNEATITNIEIEDWTSEENTITIEVEGIGDYEYSLDGIFYQDSNIFTGLRPGKYTAFVRDKNSCGTVTEDVFLLFYPNYFTPNNDGYNDTWQVIYSKSDINLEIFIFDRYGKLLIKLRPTSIGWDGTYNGKKMPSTDYWFRVVRPSVGEIYVGHFSLKR